MKVICFPKAKQDLLVDFGFVTNFWKSSGPLLLLDLAKDHFTEDFRYFEYVSGHLFESIFSQAVGANHSRGFPRSFTEYFIDSFVKFGDFLLIDGLALREIKLGHYLTGLLT